MDRRTAEGQPKERSSDTSQTHGNAHTNAHSDHPKCYESGSACINYLLDEQWVYSEQPNVPYVSLIFYVFIM